MTASCLIHTGAYHTMIHLSEPSRVCTGWPMRRSGKGGGGYLRGCQGRLVGVLDPAAAVGVAADGRGAVYVEVSHGTT
jgi:hypothetical protein